MVSLPFTRRNAFQLGLGALLGSVSGGLQARTVFAQGEPTDEDIFAFALNLEYMEAEYYRRTLIGEGIDAKDAGSDAGKVTGGHAAKFKSKAIKEFVEEVANNELAHVRFYRKTLGEKAPSRPTIDFDAGFAAAAKAAGLGEKFDVFENDMTVLLGGMLF